MPSSTKLMQDQAVGVFDSGVGGFSVLQTLQLMLPNENYLYVADQAYLPFGQQTNDLVYSRCDAITRFLLQQRVKAIVIACNTATAAAVNQLREKYSVPIIGMEPAIKPAISKSRSKKIGVLATPATVESHRFRDLVSRFADQADFIIQACHGWVELVEQGRINSPHALPVIRSTLVPLLQQGVDTFVLGCTHYPFLADAIRAIAGADINLLSGDEGVSRQLMRVLFKNGWQNTHNRSGEVRCWTSGIPSQLLAQSRQLNSPVYPVEVGTFNSESNIAVGNRRQIVE